MFYFLVIRHPFHLSCGIPLTLILSLGEREPRHANLMSLRLGDTSHQVAGKPGENSIRLFANHRLSEFAQFAEEPGLCLDDQLGRFWTTLQEKQTGTDMDTATHATVSGLTAGCD
jgi:hypothetical protein